MSSRGEVEDVGDNVGSEKETEAAPEGGSDPQGGKGALDEGVRREIAHRNTHKVFCLISTQLKQTGDLG